MLSLSRNCCLYIYYYKTLFYLRVLLIMETCLNVKYRVYDYEENLEMSHLNGHKYLHSFYIIVIYNNVCLSFISFFFLFLIIDQINKSRNTQFCQK